MDDIRLIKGASKIKTGTCVMIPAGSKLVLCAIVEAGNEYPVKEVKLTQPWFVGVGDTNPEVLEL